MNELLRRVAYSSSDRNINNNHSWEKEIAGVFVCVNVRVCVPVRV